MLDILARRWWAVVGRGVAAVLFGMVALVWPGITLLALVILLGVFALVDGLLLLVHAVVRTSRPVRRPRWLVVVQGVASVLLGVLVLSWPGLSALALAVLIGVWALVVGVAGVVMGIVLRREIDGEWLVVLNGALAVVLGLVLVFTPGTGALALVWLIGLYALVTGVLLVVLGVRLRSARPSEQT